MREGAPLPHALVKIGAKPRPTTVRDAVRAECDAADRAAPYTYRRFWCQHYNVCLTQIAILGWENFSCESEANANGERTTCPAYVPISDEERAALVADMVRAMHDARG